MTTIFLYGKIAQKYGKKFKFAISRPKDAIAAIDTIHEGFSKDLIDMGNAGQQYSVVVDDQIVGGVEDFAGKKKIKEVHIVPTIFGAGVGALVTGVVALATYVGTYGVVSALVSQLLLAVAFSAISFGIQALMSKPPKENSASASASSSTTSATSKSFLFTNKENVKQQGNPVPLGYGRLRIGSAVVQETIKSYPNSLSTFDEFVSQSTQEGQGGMSVVNNQQT